MIDAAEIDELVKMVKLITWIYNKLLKLHVTVISSKLLHVLPFATILRTTGVLFCGERGESLANNIGRQIAQGIKITHHQTSITVHFNEVGQGNFQVPTLNC